MEALIMIAFCVIVFTAFKLAGKYFDDEIIRRTGTRIKTGDADLD